MPETTEPRVVIVGGGFAGLHVALGLRRAAVRVTLIDRRNFHLFQPLLYQVATGALSPANIAAPLRSLVSRQSNTCVLLGHAIGFDVSAHEVILADGRVGYDTLVVAPGVTHHYFGRPDWEQFAPGLKTVEDATEIRRRLLLAFERAERCDEPSSRRPLLTFVIVGAGPTGVELAGAISELARHTLRQDFRAIDPATARIILVEGSDRVLPPYRPVLSERALRSLEKIGVEVLTGAVVTDIRDGEVSIRRNDRSETIAAATILWAAGVQASPLGKKLTEVTGASTDHQGRVIVNPDLTVPGHPDVFVIGDLAACRADPEDRSEKPRMLPAVAPVAMQQGDYVARAIQLRRFGQPVVPFRYHNKGNMAAIGRAAAVADLGWIWFSGFPAWLIWLFVHLMHLVSFQNRVLVLVQWAWNYFTRNRAARLITGEDRDRPAPPSGP